MKEYEKCEFYGVEFKNCSTVGNPSYWISFVDSAEEFHRAYTASNSSAGYTANNYRYAEIGSPIFLRWHFTKKGNAVVDMIKHNSPNDALKEASC